MDDSCTTPVGITTTRTANCTTTARTRLSKETLQSVQSTTQPTRPPTLTVWPVLFKDLLQMSSPPKHVKRDRSPARRQISSQSARSAHPPQSARSQRPSQSARSPRPPQWAHFTLPVRPPTPVIQSSAQLTSPPQRVQPSTQTARPSTQTARPSTQSARPSTQSVQPSTQSVRPSTQSVQPSTQSVRRSPLKDLSQMSLQGTPVQRDRSPTRRLTSRQSSRQEQSARSPKSSHSSLPVRIF